MKKIMNVKTDWKKEIMKGKEETKGKINVNQRR